jgi:hypothetical protein
MPAGYMPNEDQTTFYRWFGTLLLPILVIFSLSG